MHKQRMLTGASGTALVVAAMCACGSADKRSESQQAISPSVTQAQMLPDGRQHLSGHLTSDMAEAPVIDELPPSKAMSVLVALPVRDREAIRTAVDQVSDPQSPHFRKYLKPEEFGERYGASVDDYQRLVAWAESKNFTVTPHPNRLVAFLDGSAADVEAAFDVRLVRALRPDGTTFFRPDTEPSVDLSMPIAHVSGLDDYAVQRPAKAPASAQSSARDLRPDGDGYGGYLTPGDLQAAYLHGDSYFGTGQTVGLYEPGAAGGTPANWLPSDINYWETYVAFFAGTLTQIGAITEGTAFDEECEGDIEMVMALAPQVNIVAFTDSNDVAFEKMASNAYILQFSSSFFPTISTEAGWVALQEMALQGQSIYSASGDSGGVSTWGSGTALDLRLQPTVTSVGGTTLSVTSEVWQSEVVWDSSGGASSGWVSEFAGGGGIVIPPYQGAISMAANGGSTVYRNMPDVSASASYNLAYFNGHLNQFGGTSAAAPLWAAFTAVVNEVAEDNGLPPVGFANPALYQLARGSNYGSLFHDITSGCSYQPPSTCVTGGDWNAETGYDLATGLGSPTGALVTALAGVPPAAPRTSAIVFENSSANEIQSWLVKPTNDENGYYGNTYLVPGLPDGGTVALGPESWMSGYTIRETGDFNGDGQGDLLFWDPSSGSTMICLMRQGTILSTTYPGSVNSTWSMVGTGDFNGDGTDDILWYQVSTGTVEVWGISNGQANGYYDVAVTYPPWVIAATGNFNGNGTDDILWLNTSNWATAIWKISDFTLASATYPGYVTSAWTVAGLSWNGSTTRMRDVNGDGTADILWINTSGGVEAWLIQNGYAANYWGLGNDSGWTFGAVADFNGDGLGDILWGNAGSYQIWQIEPNGTTSPGFTYTPIGPTMSSSWALAGVVAE